MEKNHTTQESTSNELRRTPLPTIGESSYMVDPIPDIITSQTTPIIDTGDGNVDEKRATGDNNGTTMGQFRNIIAY